MSYYANRGWLVLPLHGLEGGRCSCGEANCRSPGKHPRSQHGVKDASIDANQINDWWKRWPDANVGIATGVVSNLVVVDIDPRNGGNESYAQLKLDLPGVFTEMVKVSSGSGGIHVYFQHPGGHLPCRANMRPGIDVKADGGYIVGPPSLHISGARYLFTSNNVCEAPLLPLLFAALSLPKHKHSSVGYSRLRIALDSLHLADPIKALIRDGKPQGQRSEAIFAVVRAMIKAGHSDDEIVAVLMDPAYVLSEKPREMGEPWLRSDIKRGREKPDQDPGPHRHLRHQKPPVYSCQQTCLRNPARGNPLALASAHSFGEALPDRRTAWFGKVAGDRIFSGNRLKRRYLDDR